MHSNQSSQQNKPTAFLNPNHMLSKLAMGFIGYVALMTISHAQTVNVTGNIPYAADLKNQDGSLKVWTMSKIRKDKHETVNPIEGTVMIKDSNSLGAKLGDRSYIPKETKPTYNGTLDLTNTVLPATIAILVDDIATLTITEIPTGNEPAGHTPFTDTYKVNGTALWNPKSYKEFSTPLPPGRTLPPGRKYHLNLVYTNNANLTANYTDGKVDVDGVSVYISLMSVDLMLDYDRDGQDDILSDIGDTVPADKPFRFWVNDDHDVGDDAAAEDDPENSSNITNRISCLRDLEDYVRLHVDLNSIKELVKQGKVKVGFRFVDVESTGKLPGIGVYLAADTQGGKDDYLFDENAAKSQFAGDFKNRVADVFPLYEAWLDNSVVQHINDDGHLHLIFDGSSAGSGNLVLLLKWPNHTTVEAVKIPMMIRNVRDMYEHWTAGDDNTTGVFSIPTNATKTSDSGSYDHTSPENGDVIVFVHGWRMRPWERRDFADTSYKRLWHQGFHGRFFHFSWPTEFTERSAGWPYEPLDKDNYADSEEKAYWSGARPLKNFLDTLNTNYPEKVRLFAHSMGGIVASEALLKGASLHTYAACQTAVAGHAYDKTAAARPATALNLGSWDTPEVYANYPPTGVPYYESIVGNVFNFHNELDDALVGWESGQDLKPNGGGLSPNENYRCDDFDEAANTGIFNYDEGIFYPQRDLLFPLNRYEIFAHCAEARSYAVGARNIGSVRQNFDIRRDFSDPAFAFGADREGHSGQFLGTNMIRHEFWKTLLSSSCFDIETSRAK